MNKAPCSIFAGSLIVALGQERHRFFNALRRSPAIAIGIFMASQNFASPLCCPAQANGLPPRCARCDCSNSLQPDAHYLYPSGKHSKKLSRLFHAHAPIRRQSGVFSRPKIDRQGYKLNGHMILKPPGQDSGWRGQAIDHPAADHIVERNQSTTITFLLLRALPKTSSIVICAHGVALLHFPYAARSQRLNASVCSRCAALNK